MGVVIDKYGNRDITLDDESSLRIFTWPSYEGEDVTDQYGIIWWPDDANAIVNGATLRAIRDEIDRVLAGAS